MYTAGWNLRAGGEGGVRGEREGGRRKVSECKAKVARERGGESRWAGAIREEYWPNTHWSLLKHLPAN